MYLIIMIKSYTVYVCSAECSAEYPFPAGLPSGPWSNFQRHHLSWQCLHTRLLCLVI